MNEVGDKTESDLLEAELLELYKDKFINHMRTKLVGSQILEGSEFAKKIPVKTIAYVLNPTFESRVFKISFDALEISPHKPSRRNFSYAPISISPQEKVSKIEKLSLCIKCQILFQLKGVSPQFGKIICGRNSKHTKLVVEVYKKEAEKLLDELRKLVKSKIAPNFYQCNHCKVCEFQESCRTKLIQKDDLSLLGKISEKEVIKNNNKGIFTIKQLSYTFRPKRRRKAHNKNQRYSWGLKALALREKQTYIQEIPRFQDTNVEIYLDLEGLPQESFNYLIGVLIAEGDNKKQLSLWADSKEDEKQIFKQFFDLLSDFNDFSLYHYGNYEIRSLRKILKGLNHHYEDQVEQIIKKSVNILSFFNHYVYPPTYTNELKEIASFLGFRWSEKNASGIQSIVWRRKWEISKNPEYKTKLIQYNIQDCFALKLIKEWLVNVREALRKGTGKDFVKVENMEIQNPYKFGKANYLIHDLGEINKLAYFDYQRKRIFLRTNKNFKNVVKRKIKKVRSANKVDKTIVNSLFGKCPSCECDKVTRAREGNYVMFIDLKFSKNGIKRWITRIRRQSFYCQECGELFTPGYLKGRSIKYGNNLMVWSINQHIVYRISSAKIVNMLLETFNIQLPNRKRIYRFKEELSTEYKSTYDEIKRELIKGPLIHADETKVNIRGFSSGYVWVFANMDTVYYLFNPTRETDFLKRFLNDFRGVLVSDFYKGYDAIQCQQQKCLIHLMRDLNNDLFKNQLDMEFKHLVSEFGKVLRKIIKTVDTYGLRKRHLNKHEKDVAKFYKEIVNQEYESEITAKYQTRLKKYKDKLFTFLGYDGIPWNNNNAEHAIKPFASYRKETNGSYTEISIKNHLVLLTIQQTCEYRGINFLEFLKCKEKSIEDYSKKA